MPSFTIEPLLAALPGAVPCGLNLEYDAAFDALRVAGAGKPEQEYGDAKIAAVPPDWAKVHELALELAGRTRDLRVAVWLTRSGARLGGLSGAVQGLRLVAGLLDQHWAHVHPQLDASDNDDATERVNALAPLAGVADGLADFRAAALTSERMSLKVRDLELAIAHAKPHGNEPVPTEEGVMAGLAMAVRKHPDLPDTMSASHDLVTDIALRIEQQLGVASGLDLLPLHRLLKCVKDAAKRVQGEAVLKSGAAGSGQAAAAASGHGAIASREDVARVLDRACEWIERNEPSHPAPLLIRRAQRLMTKSFVEIIRDIAPDGLGQLEKVAGERFE